MAEYLGSSKYDTEFCRRNKVNAKYATQLNETTMVDRPDPLGDKWDNENEDGKEFECSECDFKYSSEIDIIQRT